MEFKPNSFVSKFQLWNCCAKNDTIRPNMEYVFFINGYAYATNAHVLVKMPLAQITTLPNEEYAKLNGFCIHASTLKLLTTLGTVAIDCNDDACRIEGWIGFNKITIDLQSNTDTVPPNFESIFEIVGQRTPISKIGVSQKFLNYLTSAMGVNQVKLDFVSESKQIIVTPLTHDYEGTQGVIMPIMITGSLDL